MKIHESVCVCVECTFSNGGWWDIGATSATKITLQINFEIHDARDYIYNAVEFSSQVLLSRKFNQFDVSCYDVYDDWVGGFSTCATWCVFVDDWTGWEEEAQVSVMMMCQLCC